MTPKASKQKGAADAPAAKNKKEAATGKEKPRGARHRVIFVTGNSGKLEDFKALLEARSKLRPHFKVRNLDLVEVQGSHEEIALAKCCRAAELIRGPVLIEDTSLEFTALKGLPGPYIKWFWNALRNENLPSLLAAYSDKSAVAKSFVAYTAGPGEVVKLFYGECRGHILDAPRGPDVHGWLPLFVPEGHERSLAEMDLTERYQHYHRTKAFVNFFSFFDEKLARSRSGSDSSLSSLDSEEVAYPGSLGMNIFGLPMSGGLEQGKNKNKK